jgi:hypothetical protein
MVIISVSARPTTFQTVLHRQAIMTPEVQKLIVRSVEWAATGTVAE